MGERGMSYSDTVRKYWSVKTSAECSKCRSQLHLWEHLYLTEGAEGFMTECRGRGLKGRPKKKTLLPEAESDLLDAVHRLRECN